MTKRHKISEEELRNMLELAEEARSHSYCEYSGYRVGASVRTASGKIYNGCNVENSSYGATVCAERVAIFKAISDGERHLTDLMVVTDEAWPPCGLCRQVIGEFAQKGMMIHIANPDGVKKSLTFEELMPMAFVPEHMIKSR